MYPSQLGPEQRRDALARMASETLDILVIGGGVTGAGAALDAATRGLAVGLVEARDYASGTSSRSSKLIHGGLRYLEQRNFALVREALRERSLLLQRLAPHLVRPVPFLFPLTHRGWQRAYIGAGVLLYDTLGGARAVPRHRHLTRRGALRLAPALRPETLTGGIQYYDAQVDDARHTMTVARTATHYGAAVANSARVIGFLREGERVTGVRVRDLETGSELDVHAREVINATGVWTDDTQELAGGRGRFQVRASKGIHLVVPRDRIHADTGIITRTAKSVLFVIPWGRHWLIGTTDTDWNLDKAHPAASRADIDYLLQHINTIFTTPVTHEDVEGVYAGLRPLLAGESEATSNLSREHRVAHPVAGLTVIAGGSLHCLLHRELPRHNGPSTSTFGLSIRMRSQECCPSPSARSRKNSAPSCAGSPSLSSRPTTSSAPRARSSAGTRTGNWPSSASSASAFPRSTAGPGHPTR